MGGGARVAAQTARAHEQLSKAVRAGIIDQREMNVLLGQARERFVDATKQASGFRSELRVLAQLAAGQAVASAVPGVGGFMLGSAIGRRGMLAAGGVVGGLGIAAGIGQLATAGDQLRLLQAQLRAFTESSQAADAAWQGLIATSRETGTSIQDNAVLLRRLTQAQKDLGASTEEIITFQETVQKLMVASGSATSEASAGTLQLAQALASGRVQGDEFRSIMENMTEVARAAAKGLYEMGVLTQPTIGALNELREEGALTAKDFFQAILTQGPRANTLFSQMPDTIGRAAAGVGNELLLLTGHLGETTGATDAAIGALRGLESVLRSLQGIGDIDIGISVPGWVTSLLGTPTPGQRQREFALRKKAEEERRQVLGRLGQGAEEIGGLFQPQGKAPAFASLAEYAAAREHKRFQETMTSDEADKARVAAMRARTAARLEAEAKLQKAQEEAARAAEARARAEQQEAEAAARLDASRRERLADLGTEREQTLRLLAAQQQGGEAYETTKIAIEGENAARAAGLDLSSELGRAIAREAMSLADLQIRLAENEERMQRRIDQLKETIKITADLQLTSEEMGVAAPEEQELSEPFKNALENIQSMYTDTFEDLARGTVASFEEAANSINDIFVNLASSISSLAIAAQFDPKSMREFKAMAASVGMTTGQLTALSFAPAAVGTTVGLFGGQGAREGMTIGGGVGGLAGAGIGFAATGGSPAGAMVGGLIGQTAGMLGGGLFGGLFGGGESGREIRNLRGGLGAVGGTGQAAQAVQQFDQQFIAFLTARQEAIVDQALRAAAGVSVKYGKEGPSANDLASLARSRIGPAAQALGFNVAGVTAGAPEQQFANLQKAVELFRQIESFRIGPIQTQFRDLDETFAEMGAEAARLGVATAGLAEQHLLARQALERQIRLEKVAVAEMVGALDPIAAQFQTLELTMQDAAARAIELGVSTAKVAQAHQLAAETLKRRIQLEQVAVAVQVGALDQITAQFQTLELQMQEAAAQAAAFGISTANIGRAHQLAVGALKRRIELEKIAVAETVGTLNPLMAALQTLERNMQEASARAQELGVSTAKISQAHSLAARTLIQQDLIQRHTVLGTIGAWTDLQVAFGNLNAEMQLAAIEAERFGYSTRTVHQAFALGVQELVQQDRLRRHTVLGTIGAWTDLQVAIANLNAEMQLAAIEAQRLGYAAGSVHKVFSLAVEELIQQDRLRRHANLEQIGLWSPLRRELADLDAQMQLARVEAERLGYSTAYVAREQQRLAQEIIRAHEAQIDAMALSIVNPFKELADPLREFQMELEFALLNPLNQAQRAQDEFRRVATQAAGGDLDALRQLEQAGQFYIEQMGRFGASPGQVAATQEVASVVTDALDQIERARRDAEHGVENEIRLASQRQVDKLDELVAEVRLVGEEIRRQRRF